tara:strand:- start:81 stop:491 length:411 start_codon:yes stop_codon:yes gene_type:complete
MWWRWYDEKNKPLPNKSDFRDKIFNGDFDLSSYQLQAYLCEHMLDDLQQESSDGELDHTSEKVRMLKARRKRLLEDFEKDERNKLESLYKHFEKSFDITKEEVIEECLECSGKLIDLYYLIEDKYRRKIKLKRKYA